MGSKAHLVQQVKDIQRSDPDSKQAWWDFCEANLGSIKDPARHDAEVLQQFLDSIQGPPRKRPAPAKGPSPGGKGPLGGKGTSKGMSSMPLRPAATPVFGGKGAGGKPFVGGKPSFAASYTPSAFAFAAAPAAPPSGGPVDLVSFIKTGQRLSPHWRAAWQMYVRSQGSDWNDPAKHDDDFILAFLDYIGECVEAQIDAGGRSFSRGGYSADGKSGKGGKGGKGGGDMANGALRRPAPGGAPMAKRPRVGNNGSEKALLVDRVKQFQRKDPESKELWWSFCDSEHKGVRDPARHDEDVLREFLDAYDMGVAAPEELDAGFEEEYHEAFPEEEHA